MKLRFLKSAALMALLLGASNANAGLKLNFPMGISNGAVTETVSGTTYRVESQYADRTMEISSPDGKAWRTDGYSTYIQGNLPSTWSSENMTAEITFAIDTNAIVRLEGEGADNVTEDIASCINGNQGWAFRLGRYGNYEFVVYVNGQLVSLKGDQKLQLWQWYKLTATVEGSNVKLYLNGNLVKEATANGTGVTTGGQIRLGRGQDNNDWNGCRLCDFNGAIDQISAWDEVKTPSAYNFAYADLNLPGDRYKNDLQRPVYHGQPGMNWTNETHGMYYNPKDGKYHVIFQRTGSVPVMQHAHYGHITSANLVDWEDDKPMIWPTESYDFRGCWSGCLFTDSQINGGKPAIIYTGVSGGSASCSAIAYCDDDVNLRSWHKVNELNPIATYGNVARDTYFFRVDANNAYFIIGDEGFIRNYKYNGKTFTEVDHFFDFPAGESGFTEMPNVTKLPNGKWMMTYTPWTGSVRAFYRIGDINEKGQFVNYTDKQLFDCFATAGFNLMSPTIAPDKDGNLIAIGIVADKLNGEYNLPRGYAHRYSLPRTLYVDSEGRLCQKAFNGHEAMFGSTVFNLEKQTLNGKIALNPVRGRQAEVSATFQVADAPFGFHFMHNSKGKGGKVTYDPNNHTISIDVNDIVIYGNYGQKTASYQLPVYPAKGETMKLQLFVDHSICDLFINDRYATSFNVFTDDMNQDLWEVFSNGDTELLSLSAHMVKEGHCSATAIEPYVPKPLTIPANSGKVAFLRAAGDMSAQENAALGYFNADIKGTVVTTAQANTLTADKYDCVWVHIDRMNVGSGYRNLPAEFISDDVINSLKAYQLAGGNLLLTGHATQLVEAIGRVEGKFAPNEVASGNGGNGRDEWTMNTRFAGKDNHTHPIFNDLKVSDNYTVVNDTYGLLWGGGDVDLHREDHNCLWAFERMELNASGNNRVEKFQNATHSDVLGAWGQVKDDTFAGVIEFYPLANENGTVLCNGLAAAQWYCDNGTNVNHDNLRLFTANMIAYLASATGVSPVKPNPGGEVEIPEEPEGPEVLESTGKVGLYIGFESEDALKASGLKEEIAVYDFFTARYGKDHVVTPATASTITTGNYDCVWVNVDRMNITSDRVNLPAEFVNNDFKNILADFVANGGNLYLTKHAAQLVVEIGRTAHAPNTLGSGDGGSGNDIWKTNITNNGQDWTEHAIFQSIPVVEDFGHKHIELLGNTGGLHREDHNTMWNMNSYGGYQNFCNANKARVLGTWGHNGGDAMDYAGLIEFLPQRAEIAMSRAISKDKITERQGTVIANGLAAYEWAPRNNGVNQAQSNIETLTDNVLKYLSPVEAQEPITAVDELTAEGKVWAVNGGVAYCGMAEDTILTVYSTDGIKLARTSVCGQGVVALETNGVVIVVVDSKTGKTVTKLLF